MPYFKIWVSLSEANLLTVILHQLLGYILVIIALFFPFTGITTMVNEMIISGCNSCGDSLLHCFLVGFDFLAWSAEIYRGIVDDDDFAIDSFHRCFVQRFFDQITQVWKPNSIFLSRIELDYVFQLVFLLFLNEKCEKLYSEMSDKVSSDCWETMELVAFVFIWLDCV